MLRAELLPTPLLTSGERSVVDVSARASPSRFRGLQILRVFTGLAARIVWWRLTGQYDPRNAGVQTRERLERLGGLWIKVGQLLSLRVDLFPNEFWSELSRLQDQAPGFPAQLSRMSVERELGGPIERYFSEFDAEPFAAASTAQVHRARLIHNDVEVAVKVQRPGIARDFESELGLLGWIAGFLDLFGIGSHLQLGRLRQELRQILAEETDYRYEAANIRRMGRLLKKHDIYIPEVFTAFSTRHILVTELLRGVLMSDYIMMLAKDPARVAAWSAHNDMTAKTVGRRLINSLLRQIFEDNLYHGDLHPGNIMLLRGNRVALIDFGTVGFTDTLFLARYNVFIRSVGEQDFAKAADALLLLGSAVPEEKVDWLRAELVHSLRNWSLRTHVTTLPFHERSISTVATQLLKILAAAKVVPDWSFLRIRRAEHTLDASIVHLAPNTNYSKIGRRYFRRYDSRQLERFVESGPVHAVTDALAAFELGRYTLEETKFTASSVRRDALAVESAFSSAIYCLKLLLTQLVVAMVVVCILAAGAFLHQHPVPFISAPVGPSVFDSVPRLSVTSWSLVLLAGCYLTWLTWRLREGVTRRQSYTHSTASEKW